MAAIVHRLDTVRHPIMAAASYFDLKNPDA